MSKSVKEKKKSRIQRLISSVGMPEGALGKDLYIQLYSDKTVSIEGNCSVLNYSDEKIAVNSPEYILSVCGKDLSIDEFSGGSLDITGRIISISFC